MLVGARRHTHRRPELNAHATLAARSAVVVVAQKPMPAEAFAETLCMRQLGGPSCRGPLSKPVRLLDKYRDGV